MKKLFKKIVKQLASMKLAVFTMSGLVVLMAIGTVVESKYDAYAAQQLVYSSLWMRFFYILLIINLTSVILDRYPWKKHHLAFIFAHIGIIIIIYGAYLTQQFGIDGVLRLDISGEPNKNVTLQQEELVVYTSKDGLNFEKVHEESIDTLKNPIKEDKKIQLKLKNLDIQLDKSYRYALPQKKIVPSSEVRSGSAIKVFIANDQTSFSDWLFQRSKFDQARLQLGPLLMSLGGNWQRSIDQNEIRFYFENEKIKYLLFSKKNEKPILQGIYNPGDEIKTPWMNFKVKLISIMNQAESKADLIEKEYPTPLTSSALRLVQGDQVKYLFLNDYIKFYTEDRVYLIAFMQKKIPLNFELKLKKFNKTDYPGSMKAMAYQSEVEIQENPFVIAMNQPAHFQKFSFYQASFEENQSTGLPEASVLSVNFDPGRVWKYIGSLIMCLGIVLLFFRKKLKQMDLVV